MATCSCTKTPPPARKSGVSRYKGIETLLRRIAFNLGNTPSQTEVKIISCIPIDVTDLQHKILSLEKQLEHLQCKRSSENKGKAVAPLIVNRIEYTNTGSKESDDSTHDKLRKNRHKANDLSLYLDDEYPCRIKRPLLHDQLQTEPRNVFGQIIPERDRTRLVYYAQTAGSPFTDCKKDTETKKEDNPDKPLEETMDAEYLKSLVERQHLVKMYTDDDMLGSQGSAPVCRDVPRCSGTSDDMCSCCQGNFLDVDCKIRKRPTYNPNIDSGNIYYDSSFYDMKPVREKPGLKNNEQIKERAPEMNFTFYPEYYRFNPEHPLHMDMPQNCCRCKPVKHQKKERRTKPLFIPNDSSLTDGLVEFSHVYPKRLSPKQELRCNTNKPGPKDAVCNAHSGHNTESHLRLFKPGQMLSVTKLIPTSNHLNEPLANNAECVQSTTNVKCPVAAEIALQTSSLSQFGSTHANLKVMLKNAACLALPAHETECQTDLKGAQSEFTKPSEPNKTESTLNQIKTMLETVLTEVKTNNTTSVLRVMSEKETKDAIVQNDPMSSSECERILNSYTYSPYAMINPYIASCSHTLPSYCSSMLQQTLSIPRQGEVPRTHLNYAQNFPELVHHQTVAAHACCPERNHLMQPKQMSTCATNTMHEPPRKRTTETENLIKEIYKSIKLDVEFPAKTASRSAVDDAKSKNANKTSPEREAPKKLNLGREEIIFRGDVGTRRETRKSSPSESSLNARQKRRGGSFHQAPRHITSAQRRQCIVKKPNIETPESGSESESGSDDEPSASPAAGPSKPAKKGFFGKVMSSVVKRMRRKEENQAEKVDKRTNAVTQDSETSDETPVQRDRPVKHVSYAPAERSWNETSRPMSSSSKTRRLGQSAYRRPPDRPIHQPQRMPRYVPRSVLRPHSGSSQVRRAIYRPQAPHRPRTPPEYMRRVPHNQYDWRTTPTRSVHRMAPISTNDYKPKIPTKSPGLKITNKTWMRKPVYHLGFACGPEKEKIMMQY